MVGIVVVSHSARLAEGVVELAREMAADVRLEAAGGIDPGDDAPAGAPRPLGTDAARVMAAVEAADDGDGVLVLMDLGSAVLSAEAAMDLIDPDVAGRVRLVAAPVVEGAVAAAVAAQSGMPLERVAEEAEGALAPKRAQLVGESPKRAGDAGAGAGDAGAGGAGVAEVGGGAPEGAMAEPPAAEARFTVTVSQGLHARPAARFVRTAAEVGARVEVENATTGAGPAQADSLNAIATLGVREGHDVTVRAWGPQAAEAIKRLRAVATAKEAPARPAPASPPPISAGLRPYKGLKPDVIPRALRGIPSSPGIAIGPVRRLAEAAVAPPIEQRPSGSPDEEWDALARARTAVRDDVAARRDRLAGHVGGDEAEILDALALALDDPTLLRPAREAIDAGRSAARAWADAVDAIVDRYRALDDPYQRARADDLADVGRRVLVVLAGKCAGAAGAGAGDRSMAGAGAGDAGAGAAGAGAAGAGAAGAGVGTAGAGAGGVGAAGAGERGILVARDLTPLDAAGLDPAAVAGIGMAAGGPTSHGAILARALGVPAVVALGDGALAIADGTRAILDGDGGLLLPDPSEEDVRAYEGHREQRRAAAERAAAQANHPAATRDHVTIEVAANVGVPEEAAEAVRHGADGVGLMRTEFAFLDRDAAPSEDEQIEVYRAAARALDGRTLVIRTLDAGADKPLPYLGMAPEANPFLGVRGLRLGLARPQLLATQLRAIIRVAAEHRNVKAMFPMVATRDELRAARTLLDEALEQTGAAPADGFEVGIMIEVPAAALTADALAADVDFFSLGTNDLTQYTLAAERGNAAVAALADGLHPAVLRLIAEVCAAADARGRWVGVCGELAADLAAVPLLVGLGVRELSMAAPSVPAVKAAIRTLDTTAAGELAGRAVAAATAADVRALVAAETGSA